MYNAYCGWKRARSTPGSNEYGYCRKNFLSSQTLLNIEDVKMQLVVSIADAGLLQLDSTQKSSLNRYFQYPSLFPSPHGRNTKEEILTFHRARSGGRQRQFFTIPEEYDVNSANETVLNSVIAWSFYPKLLTREGKGWRNVSTNQSITLHPTSVNKHSDTSSVKWLSYYHLMQARNRNYNAHETTAVDDFAIALLCGDSEFKVCLSSCLRCCHVLLSVLKLTVVDVLGGHLDRCQPGTVCRARLESHAGAESAEYPDPRDSGRYIP